jgi:hypothetical protein
MRERAQSLYISPNAWLAVVDRNARTGLSVGRALVHGSLGGGRFSAWKVT